MVGRLIEKQYVRISKQCLSKKHENFLAAVAEAGNVTYKNQQADDVTAQYMDVETLSLIHI